MGYKSLAQIPAHRNGPVSYDVRPRDAHSSCMHATGESHVTDPEISAVSTGGHTTLGSVAFYTGAVLLCIAYATLFLLALDGQSINPQVGYGNIFWSGVFFYFLWRRRKSSGRNGAIIGGLVGLLVFVGAAFVAGVARGIAGH